MIMFDFYSSDGAAMLKLFLRIKSRFYREVLNQQDEYKASVLIHKNSACLYPCTIQVTFLLRN